VYDSSSAVDAIPRAIGPYRAKDNLGLDSILVLPSEILIRGQSLDSFNGCSACGWDRLPRSVFSNSFESVAMRERQQDIRDDPIMEPAYDLGPGLLSLPCIG
jgi:hypothetical protein